MVAKPMVEKDCPPYAEPAEQQEGRPPMDKSKHEEHQIRSGCATPARAHPHDALGANSLAERQPAVESPGQIGTGYGFAGAEQEAPDGQRKPMPAPGRV